MTAKNLAPDAGREITALKRRVSDLERMLDRIRRTVGTADTGFNTPFASFTGGTAPIPDGSLTDLTPVDGVADPTRHIHIGDGSFLFRTPGFYEIGGTIRFSEGAGDGDRTLAIQPTVNGTPGFPAEVLTVDRAPGAITVLSGSRIVHADQAAVIEWRIAAAHNAGADLDVECLSFWTRFVTIGDPATGG